MSANSTSFPAFIRAEYDANAGGFPAFQQDAVRAFDAVDARGRKSATSMEAVGRTIAQALSGVGKGGIGNIDLDVSGLKAQAQAARDLSDASARVAAAARRAAMEQTAQGVSARLTLPAIEALAHDHEVAAQKAYVHAAAMEAVQKELNQAGNAMSKLTMNSRNMSLSMVSGATSAGQLRMATIGAGQQLQDIAVQFASGQRGATIFAQQLPQLGFALSALEGSTDKTLARLGAFGTFLSGPWGVVIPVAAMVLGGLADGLGKVDEAAQAAKKASDDFRTGLLDIGKFADSTSGKMLALADSTIRAAMAMNMLKQKETADQMASLQQSGVTKALDYTRSHGSGPRGIFGDFGAKGDPDVGAALRKAGFHSGLGGNTTGNLYVLEREISKAAEKRPELRGLADDISLIAAQSTNAYRSMKQLRESMDFLTGKRVTVPGFKPKAGKGVGDPNDATTAQVTKILVSAFGGTVTSAKRTAAENARVGGAANSYHLSGHAIDFVPAGGMGSISKAQIRQTIEAAGLTVKELLGPGDKGHSDHYHVAWSGGKGEIDSARIAAQVMAEQKRAADELARATESLIQRFDASRAAETEYGNSLAEIDRLRRAGMISELQAKTFANQADIQLAAAAQKRAAQDQENLRKSLFGDGPTAGEQLWTQMQASMDRSAEDARRIAESMSIGADAIGRAFGGKFASILNEIARIDGSDGTFGKALGTIGKSLEDSQKAALRSIGNLFKDSDAFKGLGKTIGDVLGAAGIGVAAGSLALGSGNSKTGSAIGGALGKVAGKALGDVVGGTLGKALGPLGSIAGGILGGMIGGLFKKAKFGSVTIGATGSGTLGLTGSAGNSGAAIKTATKSGNAVIDSIEAIAQQLGGTIDASKGSVSIGTYKGKYRVDTSGQGRTKGMTSSESTNESLGLFNFGDDADAAVKFAMLNLVQDGVIVGIRAGSAKLLKNAKDIETGLSKALKFENVFRDLRKFKDPVGAAIDDLNLEFKGLIDVFKEAGATAAETAQLEELYGIKRKAATEDAIKSLTGSLKDLIDNLTIGDSGYSLRTRLGNAKAAYDPLAARVQAGDTTAYDEYAKAAQTLVDLQREYSGSQQDYFNLLDSVTQLTQGELSRQQAQISSSTGIGSPFDSTPIVSVLDQQTTKLQAMVDQGIAANDNQGKMIALMQQYLAAAAGTGNTRLALSGRFGF